MSAYNSFLVIYFIFLAVILYSNTSEYFAGKNTVDIFFSTAFSSIFGLLVVFSVIFMWLVSWQFSVLVLIMIAIALYRDMEVNRYAK